MMALYIVAGVVGGIVLLVLVIGFTSPRMAKMNRTIEINANSERIFTEMDSLKNFVDNWSPWTAKDPDAKHEYNEVLTGVGAKYSWVGNKKKVGSGTMEIVESESNKRVKTLLRFNGRGDAYASWYIESIGENKCKVTWDFESDNGNNPVGRIFGRMMDKFLGPDYEAGLSALKAQVEGA